MKFTFPPESIEKALVAAEEAGLLRAVLLKASGLSTEGDLAPLHLEELCDVYEQAALLTGDPAFGLHVGERTSPRMYGILGYVAANSASFGEALAELVAFQRLWTEAAGLELTQTRDTLRLRYWYHDDLPRAKRRHESEQMLAALVTFARTVLSSAVRPLDVRFEHRAPVDVAEHRRVFGCPVTFDAKATEIVFPAELGCTAIASADPTLGAIIKAQAEAALEQTYYREPFLERLNGLARSAILGSGEPSLSGLAAALGTAPRTLQRRLHKRGLSFRRVIDDARISLAKHFLKDPELALGQIAFRLGFSQPSAFHRAFVRQTGLTPQRFREALQEKEQRH